MFSSPICSDICVSDLLRGHVVNDEYVGATGEGAKAAPEALAEALRHEPVDDRVEAAGGENEGLKYHNLLSF